MLRNLCDLARPLSLLTGIPRRGGDHHTKNRNYTPGSRQRHGQQLPHRMHILQRVPPNAGTQNYLSGAFHTPGTRRGEGCSLELSWPPGGVVVHPRMTIPFTDNLEWRGNTDPGLQFLVWGRSFVPKTESSYRFRGGARPHEGLDGPRETRD